MLFFVVCCGRGLFCVDVVCFVCCCFLCVVACLFVLLRLMCFVVVSLVYVVVLVVFLLSCFVWFACFVLLDVFVV